jgi:hypothetical protein
MSARALTTAALGVVLVIAALATPAAAATRTWYVAKSGSGGGSCAHPDFHTIQSAITAAGRGDTILVCDGTYTEILAIVGPAKDRLKVKAVHRGKAVVRVPAGAGNTNFFPNLVRINNADNVLFSGFTLAARGAAPCAPVAAMIQILGSSTVTTVAHNRLIVASGSSDYNDPCGYGAGITNDMYAATALIDDNEIVDFGLSGIVAGGSNPRVTNNVLRFAHADMGFGVAYDGIEVRSAANVIVRGNHIESLATAGTSTPMLTSGIRVADSTAAIVSRNTVRYAYNGIMAGSWVGGRIRANTVRHSIKHGIWLGGSKSVDILSNSALGSGTYDCIQIGTAGPNTWTDNIGKTSKPAGLCSPP